MDNITKLKYWTYKILPLVYDDSLSYYEVLSRVTQKVNELVDSNNSMPQAIADEITNQLKDNYAIDINNKVNTAIKEITDNSTEKINKLATTVYINIANAIATDEGTSTFTASAKSGGELIWLNDTLYKVVAVMPAGTNYIVGTNIVPIDISEEIRDIKEEYLSSNNEHWNERSAKNYDTGVYLYWKDVLYITTKDIKVNDILYSDGNNKNLKQITLGNEISNHYNEMHEADNNLQTQIDGNDGDIERLQAKDVDLQGQITNNNTNVNNRISNIVAQSSTDNTEVVDARQPDTNKFYNASAQKTLKDSLNYQFDRAVTGLGTSISDSNVDSTLPSHNVIDQLNNSIYQYYTPNTKLTNAPFDQINSYTIAKLSFSDTGYFALYIAASETSAIGGIKIAYQHTSSPDLIWTPLNYNDLLVTPLSAESAGHAILTSTVNSSLLQILMNIGVTGYRVSINDGMANNLGIHDIFTDIKANTIYTFYDRTSEISNLPFDKYSGQTIASFILSGYNNRPIKGLFGILLAMTHTEQKPLIKISYDYGESGCTPWEELPLTSDIQPYLNKVDALSNLARPYQIFKRVGCIGDSYTAGYIINTETQQPMFTNNEFSWPVFMSKNSGNIYDNFAISGSTSITYMTGHHDVTGPEIIGDIVDQAYIIGLGLNDKSYSTPVGTIDDCGTDAQTYYSYMYKIIEMCHNKNNKAFIFIQTMPNHDTTYNEAIRAIADKYKDSMNLCLLDLDKDYYDLYHTAELNTDALSGHYTAIGYSIFAENMAYVLDDYISKNLSKFKQVAFIPYDKTTPQKLEW